MDVVSVAVLKKGSLNDDIPQVLVLLIKDKKYIQFHFKVLRNQKKLKQYAELR